MRLRAAAVATASLALGLAACSGEPYGDLRQWVKESENLPHGKVPPLPQVKPYEPFTYAAFDLIDPFKARKIEPPKTAGAGGLAPDMNRRREPLEAYPLESLKMVGTLEQKKQVYALVKAPDNTLILDATAKTFRYLDDEEIAAQRKVAAKDKADKKGGK